MNEENFWLRVKELLKNQGITQKELSKKLELNDRAVDSWVQKGNVPGVFDCYKISQILGVSIDYLLTGEEDNRYKDLVNKIQKDIIDSGLQIEVSSQQ